MPQQFATEGRKNDPRNGQCVKTAFVTGVTGQDGYYLSRLLLSKGYQVHGLVRADSTNRRGLDRLATEMPDDARRLILHEGDLTHTQTTIETILRTRPDEIYNLAAQSHVRISFDEPEDTQRVNFQGAVNVLEGARRLNDERPVRVYQASTSEMFGGLPGTAPQSEQTPFHPRSPYGEAKVAAFHQTVEYREKYGLFSCNGILFNHESPLQGGYLCHPEDHPRSSANSRGDGVGTLARQPRCGA